MNLSKALKLKNKKLKEYSDTLSKAVSHNSYDVDTKQIYNSKELYEQSIALLNDYIKLKTSIHLTSQPIRSKIFELGELKSLLNKVSHITTTEGIQKEGYREITTRTYAASINEFDKTNIIKGIEDKIENLQDEIDTFNATTELVGY